MMYFIYGVLVFQQEAQTIFNIKGCFMKRLLPVFVLLAVLLGIVSCEPKESDPKPKDKGYTISNGIATVSNSDALKKMLSDDSVNGIVLKSGTYNDEYELNNGKSIGVVQGGNASINKLTVNSTGSKIQSPSIGRLVAGKGIEDGELELEDIEVREEAVFEGGGSNSIKIRGNSIFKGAVTADKEGLSLKMDQTVKMQKSLVILQPANLIPNDTDNPPEIQGNIVINYSNESSVETSINIRTGNLVVGDNVRNVSIGSNAVVTSLISLSAGNLKISNNGVIEQANDSSVITENDAGKIVEDISNLLQGDLLAVIALSKLNRALFNVESIDYINENFKVETKVSVTSAINLDVTWTSSNNSIISIDENGEAKVNREAVNTKVILTAKIAPTGTDPVGRDFTVTVIGGVTDRKVIFNSNGGSAVAELIVKDGSTVTKPGDPVRTGHTFAGWFKDVELKTAWDFTTDKVTENVTLYAKWTANKHTLTINRNDGSEPETQQADYGTLLTPPAEPSKTGYTFAGWFKDAEFKTAWNFTTDKVTGDVTLHANWTVYTPAITISVETNFGNDGIVNFTEPSGAGIEWSETDEILTVTQNSVSSLSITVSASFSFSDVQWYINGESVDGYLGYNTITITTGEFAGMINELTAVLDGESSGSIRFKVE